MAYTKEKPRLVPETAELRQRIPGWGVDLDLRNRPAVPKEQYDPAATGAHWDFPERQVQRYPREKSTEHRFVTPVFGTSCPPRGLSGIVRRFAFRFSEGRVAHWVLLMFADRIDIVESRFRGLLRGRIDNPIKETGILTELEYHGARARLGQRRADTKHHALDLFLVAGSSLAIAGGAFVLARGLFGARR